MGLILPLTRLLSALPPVFWPLSFCPGSFPPCHLEDEWILSWFLDGTIKGNSQAPPLLLWGFITTSTTTHESQLPAALSIPHPQALVLKDGKFYCHQQSFIWDFGHISQLFLHQEKYSWFPYKSWQESQLDHRAWFVPKPKPWQVPLTAKQNHSMVLLLWLCWREAWGPCRSVGKADLWDAWLPQIQGNGNWNQTVPTCPDFISPERNKVMSQVKKNLWEIRAFGSCWVFQDKKLVEFFYFFDFRQKLETAEGISAAKEAQLPSWHRATSPFFIQLCSNNENPLGAFI